MGCFVDILSSDQMLYFLLFPPTYLCNFSFKRRVENLKKFKSDSEDCPTLVCTDLAARGLDLDVDHVIMFDFPLNSVSIISIIKIFFKSQSSPSLISTFFFKKNKIIIGYFIFRFNCRSITSIAQVELLVWAQKVTNSYVYLFNQNVNILTSPFLLTHGRSKPVTSALTYSRRNKTFTQIVLTLIFVSHELLCIQYEYIRTTFLAAWTLQVFSNIVEPNPCRFASFLIV